MFPVSFSTPRTIEREMEKANRDVMPPSSATTGRPLLLTSCPTIPPSRIFRMSGGIVSRTTRSATRNARIAGTHSIGRSNAKVRMAYIKSAGSTGASLPPEAISRFGPRYHLGKDALASRILVVLVVVIILVAIVILVPVGRLVVVIAASIVGAAVVILPVAVMAPLIIFAVIVPLVVFVVVSPLVVATIPPVVIVTLVIVPLVVIIAIITAVVLVVIVGVRGHPDRVQRSIPGPHEDFGAATSIDVPDERLPADRRECEFPLDRTRSGGKDCEPEVRADHDLHRAVGIDVRGHQRSGSPCGGEGGLPQQGAVRTPVRRNRWVIGIPFHDVDEAVPVHVDERRTPIREVVCGLLPENRPVSAYRSHAAVDDEGIDDFRNAVSA